MSFALRPGLPIPSTCRLPDLPRQTQFLLLTIRLARELSVDHRNLQGFVYALCGITRVEKALSAVNDVLHCLDGAPRHLNIGATTTDNLAEDERRLLGLLRCRRHFGLNQAGAMVPPPLDEALINALNRLADTLKWPPAEAPKVGLERMKWEGLEALLPGHHTIVFDFRYDGLGRTG